MENNSKDPGKKLLMIAKSISMVLISASIFLFSVNHSFAEKTSPSFPATIIKQGGSDNGVDIFPFGVVAGKAYWIEYNASGWHFKASEISKWTD